MLTQAAPMSRLAHAFATRRQASAVALALLPLALLLPAAGCSDSRDAREDAPAEASAAAPRDDRPNIVLVTLDTTRADRLGVYGYFRDTSPRLDAFAADALVFDRLIVPMATTLPSHLSILTSSHPLEHGVLANTTQGGKRFVPAPGLESLVQVAQAAGYATGGFVSAAPLKRGSGIEVGFDAFDEPVDRNRVGGETADAALAWIEGLDGAQPYFLWVHFYDAHYPFEAPEPWAGTFTTDEGLEQYLDERWFQPTALRPLVQEVDEVREVNNAYDDELLYQDAQLGRVLDAVSGFDEGRAWDRTIVIVTGDHGEGLCQHGEAAHGSTWDEQLNAPLVVRIPGVPASRHRALLTSSDILPTVLERVRSRTAFDVSAFDGFAEDALGRDVLAPGGSAHVVLSQDTGRERDVPFKYALTSESFKYFRVEHPDGRIEERLFDLGVDPYELRNVSETLREVRDEMRDRTTSLIAERSERGASLRGDAAEVVDEADPQLLRELCALGYIEVERCEALAAQDAAAEATAE